LEKFEELELQGGDDVFVYPRRPRIYLPEDYAI
jgi:hypothetical protein